MMVRASRMTRERYPMPDFIRDALAAKKLTAVYDARPPYIYLAIYLAR